MMIIKKYFQLRYMLRLLEILLLFIFYSENALASESLYVSDFGAKVVHKLNLDGTYVKSIGESILTRPWGIVFDTQGNMLVADGTSIKVFQKDSYITSFGSEYFTSSNFASQLTVDEVGNIYVAKYGGGIIEVFNAGYQHTNTLDFRSILGGSYEGPGGVCYDFLSDNLIFTTFWARTGDRGLFEITKSGTIVREFGVSWYSHNECGFDINPHARDRAQRRMKMGLLQ